MMLSRKTLFVLTLITVLSVILRLIWLDRFPPSLYTDEADQGYNAYSILLTGKDEHGKLLPVSLRSFGDWKPPLPAYLMIPFISVIGLSEYSVRLPSVVFGVGSIILVFFLVRLLFPEEHNRSRLALLSSYFMAVSPWHMLESRAAMLVIIALFFLMLGVYFFLKGLSNKSLLLLSIASFVLSVYSYYGLRVIAPLVILILFIKFRKKLVSCKKELFLSIILGLVLISPLFFAFIRQPDVVFGRAKTVSIFYDQGINLRRWELVTQDGINADPTVIKLFHNRFYLYGRSILQRFLSHWDLTYLLLKGDQSQPFQIPNMGIIYIPDLFLMVIGIFIFLRTRGVFGVILPFWVVLSLLPAAFTYMTPSSNRTFNAVTVYVILIALGLSFFVRLTKRNIVSVGLITLSYTICIGFFLRQYFIELPHAYADYWNYGWKQAAEYVRKNGSKYDNIIIPDVYGMPYIYFLFYGKYPPQEFQKNAIRTYVADKFGYEHLEGYDKYLFPQDFDWVTTKKINLNRKSLYIISLRQAPEDKDYMNAIYYPDGKIAFKIFGYE